MTSPTLPTVTLSRLAGEYGITRFGAEDPVPPGLLDRVAAATFVSVTRTASELSIVAPIEYALASDTDGPWVAWYVQGPIPFGLTGIIGSLAAPLAEVGCPAFVVSTFDSDVLMTPSGDAPRAIEALTAAGHVLRG
ncbi:ACT domain-containing protein [Microbacterium sp. NPDC077663]|uniref:ACT domain-containing protein n=1 Tax=Microbacterium sp. NPDC077663 TaxID=3364189 RepID=UPI0037C64158